MHAERARARQIGVKGGRYTRIQEKKYKPLEVKYGKKRTAEKHRWIGRK